MDSQPPLIYSPEKQSLLNFGGIVLPSAEYTTQATVFPGTNCFAPYGTSGNFFLSLEVFSQGVRCGELHTECVNQDGCIELNFDQLTEFCPLHEIGTVHIRYSHAKDVPPELYFAHVHRKTGIYFSYPPLAFMGDEIYTHFHARQLESTLFWPGVINNRTTEAALIVVNPYKLTISYQLSLFLPDGSRQQTEVQKLGPRRTKIHSIEEAFSVSTEEFEQAQGRASVCASCQYKIIAYYAFKDRASQAFRMIDHLHPYALV